MISGITAVDTTLPGIRVWLSRTLTDLHSGRSCLWLLPRNVLEGAGSRADRLLEDLLHELADFVLLPSDESPASTSTRSPRPARSQVLGGWSGMASVPDFDDGLPDLFTVAGSAPPEPEPTPPPTSAEALAHLLERLAKELGYSGGTHTVGSDQTGNVLAQLVGRGDGGSETRTVVVRAWRELVPSASAHLLRRLVATAKEAGLPPDRRPRALVIASTEDLPTGLPDQLSREGISVHWWWGATGRLDTATVVALARPPLHSPTDRGHLYEAVTQATITEVCGPFLDIAAALSSSWEGGHPESLASALHDVVANRFGPTAVPPRRTEGVRHPGRRPDQILLTSWNTGAVESWDGRLRHHPRYDLLDEEAVAARVWLAHNHVLLPLLDDARDRFTSTVQLRARVPLTRLVQDYGPRHTPGTASEPADSTLATMELGSMWSAHCDGAISLTRTERRHLRTLRDARNLLAHRVPLDGDRLHHLIDQLCL